MFLTEYEAKVALAVRDQSGTSEQIAQRAGVVGRTTRKNLTKLIGLGMVERVMTWLPTYKWIGTTEFANEARAVLRAIDG